MNKTQNRGEPVGVQQRYFVACCWISFWIFKVEVFVFWRLQPALVASPTQTWNTFSVFIRRSRKARVRKYQLNVVLWPVGSFFLQCFITPAALWVSDCFNKTKTPPLSLIKPLRRSLADLFKGSFCSSETWKRVDKQQKRTDVQSKRTRPTQRGTKKDWRLNT